MDSKSTITVDWAEIACNPRHLTATGRGWIKRLRELGAPESECELLLSRLRSGMAAEIELARIKQLANMGAKHGDQRNTGGNRD